MNRTMDDPIISSDTLRQNRLPPHQVQTRQWPVLQSGPVPAFDSESWDLTIFPVPFINEVKHFTWHEFTALPRVRVFADMHSSLHWSLLDNLWEGVHTHELKNHVRIDPAAKFVMVHSEYGFTTNLPIDEFFGDDCLFALKHNGQELTPEQGYPVRLVIPKLYDWKSPKWVRGIEFMEADRPGFWECAENGGYHMRGDPWREERHQAGPERPPHGAL